jgi:hypothetical protein
MLCLEKTGTIRYVQNSSKHLLLSLDLLHLHNSGVCVYHTVTSLWLRDE